MGAEREGERERERTHKSPSATSQSGMRPIVISSLVIVALFVVHVRVAYMCLWIDEVLP